MTKGQIKTNKALDKYRGKGPVVVMWDDSRPSYLTWSGSRWADFHGDGYALDVTICPIYKVDR